jgi:carbonic anhydrase
MYRLLLALALAMATLQLLSCGASGEEATLHGSETHTAAQTAEAQAGMHAHASDESASGRAQSPINVLTHEAVEEAPGHEPQLQCSDQVVAVENLGHTVQLDLAPGSWVDHEGLRYAMHQAHFHTPSEHQLDGMTYPLEMHIVHTPEADAGVEAHNGAATGTTATEEQTEPAPYLVLGFLFKMGEAHPFLDEFLDRIPEEAQQLSTLPIDQVHLLDLLDSYPAHAMDHYYHYVGSLTTAPYTEGVQWFLSEHIFEASPEQIQRLRALEGENARQPQKLNGRTVFHH